jgi:hypothetical protein
MSSVLEVTVFDEDRDHKVEFLGRVAIPLLRIRDGEKRWYALKDKNMYVRAKGMNPQVSIGDEIVISSIINFIFQFTDTFGNDSNLVAY